MDGLLIREYAYADNQYLIPIINDEWHFDLYGENWPELVEEYIGEYVLRSDISRVAVFDGKVVGMVTASAEVDRSAPERLERALSEFPGDYFLDRKVMDELDEKLRSENDIHGLGELVLIIVDSSVKGMHVGSALMESASGYLRSKGCTGMHISTDTDCNYGFYEHLGAKRIGSGECIVQNKPIVRYLYRLDF